jgi:hypothetical protein
VVTRHPWTVLAASEKGSAHGADAANQDAFGSRQLRVGGKPLTVAAVSDGHGGRRYVRSATGSRLAVDAALDVLETAAAAAPEPRRLLRAAVPTIVATWRDRVREHYEAHAFTQEEVDQAGTALEVDPVMSYGATLLIAVVAGDELMLAQLGDGDIVVRCGHEVRRPMPQDDRLVAGSTTSLCLSTAVADFRFGNVPAGDRPDLVLLASDGYGNAFADAGWHDAVVSDLGQQLDVAGPAEVGRRLPNWLTESALVGGDDVTVVLLARTASVAAGAVAPARTVTSATAVLSSSASAASASAAGSPVRGARTRRGAVIAALAVIALLGATGVTYALTRSSPEQVAPPLPGESHAPGPVGPHSRATKVASPKPSPSPVTEPSPPVATPSTVVQGPAVQVPPPPPRTSAPARSPARSRAPSPSPPRPTHRASAPPSPQTSVAPSPSTPEQSPPGATTPSPRGAKP